MGDTTVRDALERSIHARLLPCSEAELRAIDRVLLAIERRRDILPEHELARDPERAEELLAGMRELRVIRGGRDRKQGDR